MIAYLAAGLATALLAAALLSALAHRPRTRPPRPPAATPLVDAQTTQPEFDALFARITGCPITHQHGHPITRKDTP
jgi:hypothetical protein